MKTTALALSILLTTVAGAVADFPQPPSSYTHVAQVSQGAWDDPATWQKAAGIGDPIPSDGAVVHIPAGKLVTIRRQESARLSFVRVDGELRMWIHSSTRLLAETIYIGPFDAGQVSTGIFSVGAACCPVKLGRIAEVVFLSDGIALQQKTAWDPKQASRGLISDGRVRLFGQAKAHMYTVSHDAPAGSTSLALDLDPGESVPAGWNAGDEVVLTGTTFRRTGLSTSSEDELRTVASQPTGNVISIGALTYDHLRPADTLDLHVANLTRNIVFRSESTAIPHRGHVMFRNGDVILQNVAFRNLGRTDKSIPLDDVIVDSADGTVTSPLPQQVLNPRGRYAVHFHMNGTQPSAAAPPSQVHGCVVVDTPGWGFVNHSSHVDFERNVAWSFTGAGFVTEAGDELGNFVENIAIRGIGNGQYRPLRIVFQNAQRPQPLSDFAFSGDGFWFQGPALRARNNVANGCDGAGMIWFTTGAPNIADVGPDGRNRYVGFDRGAVETVYGVSTSDPDFTPRHWAHSAVDEKLVISDLPIFEMDGFVGYANLVGFRLRFNNHDNVDLYLEDPFDYDEDIVPLVPGDVRYAVRLRQSIENLVLWNNEQGFRARYVTETDWNQLLVLNNLDYEGSGNATFHGHAGGELNFALESSTVANATIEGYPVGLWVENENENVRNEFSFSSLAFDDYAQFDTWNKNGLSCSAPTGLVATAGSTSATVSWIASNSKDERYLVRYRAIGDIQWRMVDTAISSTTISGLEPETSYDLQVVAGCCQPTISGACGSQELHSVSPWSAPLTFLTD